MTALMIYPGRTGMEKSLAEISQLLGSTLSPELTASHPVDALDMLRQEQALRIATLRQADLLAARRLVQAHLDRDLLRAANADARKEYRAGGGTLRLRHRGWKRVRFLLRNGLVLVLHTPYLRPLHPRKKSRRKKTPARGAAGAGVYPLLERLGIRCCVTPALREACARQVALSDSLTEAHQQLSRDGVDLDRQTLMHVAVACGRVLAALGEQVLREAIHAPLPATSDLAGLRVQVSIDGGRSHTRTTDTSARVGKNGRRPFDTGWREPRIITLTVLNKKGEQHPTYRPIYLANLGNADAVMDQVVGLLRCTGAHLAAAVVFVSDGASWIWDRLPAVIRRSGLCAERVRCVLDFWHACEYVHEVLKLCRHIKEEARKSLYRSLRHRLRDEVDGAALVIRMLQPLARGRRAKAIKKRLRFLREHLPHMDYARRRAEHLPIGSGVVESAVRRIINLRFKSASMFWRTDHLEPLLQVRALLKARRWDDAFKASLQGRSWIQRAFTRPVEAAVSKEEAA